jgi:lipid-A-disaccharide synthase
VPRFYIIAGEASGDLHGANLIKALLRQDAQTVVRAWGGDLMEAAGATVVRHYRDLAFMGFVEVLTNLRTILRHLKWCKADVLAFQPDALVLIDYPGFNLRIAKWAKQQGLRVIYYISPQIWAWHRSRVKAIRRDVDRMLVILPFEEAFYREYGVEVFYTGHPLLDALRAWQENPPARDPRLVVLLPGSRKQEIQRILPVMLETTRFFPHYQFVVAGAAHLTADFYAPYLQAFPEVSLTTGDTHRLLATAQAALVKSGTSTLEAALLDVPQVVCYKGSPLSYQIARRVIEVRYISLVNLILDAPLVRELIQNECTPAALRTALGDILQPETAVAIRAGYARLRNLLGGGQASDRAAALIGAALREEKQDIQDIEQ